MGGASPEGRGSGKKYLLRPIYNYLFTIVDFTTLVHIWTLQLESCGIDLYQGAAILKFPYWYQCNHTEAK